MNRSVELPLGTNNDDHQILTPTSGAQAMSTVLVITSSALGASSVSNQLVQDAVTGLRLRDPALTVISRDLGNSPIPHLNSDSAAALRGAAPANDAQATAQTLSEELIGELKAADTVIIGSPMYNFGIPSTLKAWFDHVLRAGITFRYTDTGPVGLLNGKRAIILAIQRQPGSNTIDIVNRIDAVIPHFMTSLPKSISLNVIYDRSQSIRASVGDVQMTLILAAVLVILVIFLFLRNISATVIPSLALPASLQARARRIKRADDAALASRARQLLNDRSSPPSSVITY
jgi:FMN-dependent NADH-azoreductase